MQRQNYIDTESEAFRRMSELAKSRYLLNTPAHCRLRAELMRMGVIKFDEAEEITDIM